MKKKEINIFVWNNSAITNCLIDKLCASKKVKNVYYANKRAKCLTQKAILAKNDGSKLLKELKDNNIEYVFSNSEANENGFIDICCKLGFKSIGCTQSCIDLEKSKIYSKALMQKYNIKTAKYFTIENKNEVRIKKPSFAFPVIIKADGYARSLSVKEIKTIDEYKKEIKKYLNGFFGIASEKVIIEEKIIGKEISIPLVLDGQHIRLLNIVKDYKKRNNADTGSNTGSMGSICPYIQTKKETKLINNLIKKIKKLLKEENLFYKGFMTLNAIIKNNEIYLLEINTRLGDSEGQVVLDLLKTDIIDIFEAIYEERIDKINIEYKQGYSIAINGVTNSYPDKRIKEQATIRKSDIQKLIKNGTKFYFYNRIKETRISYKQTYDRFFSIIDNSKDIKELRKKLYKTIKQIHCKNVFYRTDIGEII